MARHIDTDAVIDSIRLKNQGNDPAAPNSGYQSLYTKAGGLFVENSSGNVIGPFITGAQVTGSYDGNAIHDNEAGEIAAIAEKTTPIAADLVVIEDSADSNAKKRVQMGNLAVGTAWTDYGGTSTIVGWSSFTTKKIYYKKIGSFVFVAFHLAGTSDATTCSFTVPYTNSASSVSARNATGAIANSGTGIASPGLIELEPNTNVVNIYSNMNYTAWTNSGTKYITGQFFYEAA